MSKTTVLYWEDARMECKSLSLFAFPPPSPHFCLRSGAPCGGVMPSVIKSEDPQPCGVQQNYLKAEGKDVEIIPECTLPTSYTSF